MFFYFYDSFVLDKKHEGTLTRVESRIIELGINGRVEKLTPLRNMKSVLEDGIKRGAHTVVVVGDDSTFVRAVNIVAAHGIVLGYIPFSEESPLAELFGIPDTFEACNILSRRIIKAVNLGKANTNYFLTSLTAEQSTGLKVVCDNQFTVSGIHHPMQFHVHNIGDVLSPSVSEIIYPNTNRLHVQIEPLSRGRSLFKKPPPPNAGNVLPVRRAEITHTDEPIPVQLDRATTLKTPVTVTIKPKHLKVVVGKGRRV